ncbi:MAG: CdaR family protein [Armatimonadota bacterium]
MIRRNIGYKLLALGIAVIVWYYVNQGETTTQNHARKNPYITREFIVPLEGREIEPGCVATGIPRQARVSVEGRQEQVLGIAYEQGEIQAYVNLSGRGAGRYRLPVTVKLPKEYTGMLKKTAQPRYVSVNIEEKIQREMKVEAKLSGSSPDGYKPGDPELLPTKVIVYGASRSVESVQQVAAVVDLSKAGASGITGEFPLAALDKNGKVVRDVELLPVKVNLRLSLSSTSAVREVPVAVDLSGQPPFPYRLAGAEAQPRRITVAGQPERLAEINIITTGPVQVSGHRQSFTQRVDLSAPQGISFPDERSVNVQVRIAGPADESPASGNQ